MLKLVVIVSLLASVRAASLPKDVTVDSVKYSNALINYDVQSLVPESRDFMENLLGHLEQLRSVEDLNTLPGIRANLNDYADKIIVNIRELMIKDLLDPFEMPDLHSGFSFKVILITYHGEIDLTKGKLTELSTLYRGGDVIAEYDPNIKLLKLDIPIAFLDMAFKYDYSAKLMNLGPTGGIEGKAANVKVDITLEFDLNIFEASLKNFNIHHEDIHITLHFTGNILTDWILNILIDTVTILLRDVIVAIIENIVKGALVAVVEIINTAIEGILDPVSTMEVTPAKFIIEQARYIAGI